MRKTFSHFLCSEIFIIFTFIFAYLVWLFKIDYHITIGVVAALIIVTSFTCRDSRPLIPLFLSVIFCDIFHFGNNHHDVSEVMKNVNFTYIIIVGSIAILSLIYFFIRNKQSLSKLSLIGLSLILIMISFMLTDIFVKKSFNFAIFGIIVLIFYFVRYTTNYLSFKSEVLPYFSKTLFYLGILISLQTVTYYVINFDLVTSSFVPMYGWGISNNASLILLLIIPIAAYSLFKEGRAIYLVGILIMMTANILTLSRGGIGSMIVLVPLLIILFYKKYPNRSQFKYGFIITLAYFGILGILFSPYILKIITLLLEEGITDSGRFDLWRKAWAQFIASPILGGGSVLFPANGVIWQGWFHSTFFDCIGQLGLVGLLAFGTHFVIKYRSVLIDRDIFKWCALIGFLSSGFYAMADVAYFNFNYLFVYVFILAMMEFTYNINSIKIK